jgi:hypothetical protein
VAVAVATLPKTYVLSLQGPGVGFGAYHLEDWLTISLAPTAIAQLLGVVLGVRPGDGRQAAARSRYWVAWRGLEALLAVATAAWAFRLAERGDGVTAHIVMHVALSATWLPLCVYAERRVASLGLFRRNTGTT